MFSSRSKPDLGIFLPEVTNQSLVLDHCLFPFGDPAEPLKKEKLLSDPLIFNVVFSFSINRRYKIIKKTRENLKI